ncbi:hypothetical protein THAOC_16335 [Thalassiosira oceanica]|uniref:F-box domain-containing protein n=1 Tax=Thalassiosira oceanica TaxID=159749 RepID=K0SCD3_THAOC|nr:hypothetical protein THAOC_16335 [Thalassiosira oceanica]|eukprot:EJK63030.1 hypothetical protein THAOC_16335 [Thalassiosira oceanica]
MESGPCAILLLPGETLDHVLSYTLPQKERHLLEHLCVLRGVCRRFGIFARSAAPARLYLHAFNYYRALSRESKSGDKRAKVLQALLRHGWMRQNLEEFHVNWSSVLKKKKNNFSTICHTIRGLLRDLLSLSGGFPNLTWLDISIQSDHISDYQGIDGALLQHMPAAMPSLERLCLVGCFHNPFDEEEAEENEITPGQLELINCWTPDFEGEERFPLGDDSAIAVANNCAQLVSFSFAESAITTAALRRVLSANTGIRKLDLSWNRSLGSDAVEVIAQYLTHLTELRNYWSGGDTFWLNSESLKTLCDLLARNNGGDMPLSLLGLQTNEEGLGQGVVYAIHKGLKVVEIGSDSSLREELENSGTTVEIREPNYPFYIDGSQVNGFC